MYLINQGLEARQEQFIAETAADIAKLPTMTSVGNASAAYDANADRKVAAGSMALCVATGDIYVLSTSNSWDKVGG